MHVLLHQSHGIPSYTNFSKGQIAQLQFQMILLRRGSTGTSADTTELLIPSVFIPCLQYKDTYRSEFTRGSLLVSGVIPPSVLSVTSGGLVGTTLSSLSTTTVSGGSASRSCGLHVGLGNNLGRNVEVFSEVGESLIGEGVVVPLPRELGLDESLGSEGLHGLDDFEVSDGHVGVLGSVEVLGSNEDTLLEEVLVDLRVSMSSSPLLLALLGPLPFRQSFKGSKLTTRRLALVMIILVDLIRFRKFESE